jgi:hypothetical protein
MTLLFGALLASGIEVIVVHQLDGREAIVNTAQITQLIEEREAGSPHKLLSDRVHCVVTMADRRWIGTIETCEQIHAMLTTKEHTP